MTATEQNRKDVSKILNFCLLGILFILIPISAGWIGFIYGLLFISTGFISNLLYPESLMESYKWYIGLRGKIGKLE